MKEVSYKVTMNKELLEELSDDSEYSDESDSEFDDDDGASEQEEKYMIKQLPFPPKQTLSFIMQSSLDYQDCAFELMKWFYPGQEMELCEMVFDCCSEQVAYERFYGLLGTFLCDMRKIYVPPFEEIFKDTYATSHRLDINQLQNGCKFFAHLLFTNTIRWDVMECIQLNEDDINSSSGFFIKCLFQELVEHMGVEKLNSTLKDVTMQESFSGLFPRENPRNAQFAIAFFIAIGLGRLVDELSEHLEKSLALNGTEVSEFDESYGSTAISLDWSTSSDSSHSSKYD